MIICCEVRCTLRGSHRSVHRLFFRKDRLREQRLNRPAPLNRPSSPHAKGTFPLRPRSTSPEISSSIVEGPHNPRQGIAATLAEAPLNAKGACTILSFLVEGLPTS